MTIFIVTAEKLIEKNYLIKLSKRVNKSTIVDRVNCCLLTRFDYRYPHGMNCIHPACDL